MLIRAWLSVVLGSLVAHSAAAKDEQPVVKCDRFVEVLDNLGRGTAYLGKMLLGNQKVDCLWDTGSDDTIIVSARTLNMKVPCVGALTCYDKDLSQTYTIKDRGFAENLVYGHPPSLSKVVNGFEDISFIDYRCKHRNVEFMELMSSNAEFQHHKFDAICGLGPRKFDKRQLLRELGVNRFSFCLMSEDTKPGIVVWNDHKAGEGGRGFVFTSVPNSGRNYWALQVSDFSLVSSGRDSQKIGCVDMQCFCVVDSGASLITLDRETLEGFEEALGNVAENATCSEETFRQLPVLKFYVGGKEHSFRPRDYLRHTESSAMTKHVRSMLHFSPEKLPWLRIPSSGKECVLMFSPPAQSGVCILGMPFFRNYIVTFDREDRTISTAPHDGECEPARVGRFWGIQEKPQITSIDLSQLRASSSFAKLAPLERDQSAPFFLN